MNTDQDFTITYMTTLIAYYVIHGMLKEEAEIRVITLFQLVYSYNADVNNYDPLYNLITENNGIIEPGPAAITYKENTYLSILIDLCIRGGKSQDDVMYAIVSKEQEFTPTTLNDASFIEGVIDNMVFPTIDASNLNTKIANVFSVINDDTSTGITLATNITKAKILLNDIDVFTNIEAATFDASLALIPDASINIFLHPILDDPDNITIDSNFDGTTINTLTYECDGLVFKFLVILVSVVHI